MEQMSFLGTIYVVNILRKSCDSTLSWVILRRRNFNVFAMKKLTIPSSSFRENIFFIVKPMRVIELEHCVKKGKIKFDFH